MWSKIKGRWYFLPTIKDKINILLGLEKRCCEKSFYIGFRDFDNIPLNIRGFERLSLYNCSINPSSTLNSRIMSFKVNGVEYINNPVTITGTLPNIRNFYENLNIPNATYKWVTAINGLIPEPNLPINLEANVTWLVITLPIGSTVESINDMWHGTNNPNQGLVNQVYNNFKVLQNQIYETSDC